MAGDDITRGERGPAGDKGSHGQQGDPGRSGDPGQRSATGKVGPEGKSTLLSRNVSLSFILIVVVSFAVLAVMGYAIRQNRQLIHDQAQLRRELVAGFKRADILNCRAIEDLKAQNREAARLSFSRLDESLALLGIPRSMELTRIAIRNRDEALARNAAKACGQLSPQIGR